LTNAASAVELFRNLGNILRVDLTDKQPNFNTKSAYTDEKLAVSKNLCQNLFNRCRLYRIFLFAERL